MKYSRKQTEDEESSEQQQGKNNKKRAPVVAPFSQIKVKSKKHIYINLSMTHYEVIEDVAYELGWYVQTNPDKGDWDILWTDQMIDTDVLMRMHFFQKISHFPGIHVLARKNLLGLSLMEMRKKFPQQYNFFPLTWMLPSDYGELRQEFQQHKQSNKTYIVKPQASCQGKGIFLTKKIEDVENGKHYVVQQYIPNPYLIDGLKFDFRVYVLLCGTNPMRLYIYQQGLARFATEKYCEPTAQNMKRSYIHLTNYAVNKKNPKYIYNSSSNNMGIGHKRSLTSVLKQMQRKGQNLQQFRKKVDDLLVKTFIVGMPLVSHQYKYCQPEDEYRNMCFHILGVDIMLDADANPYLIQVNHTPSFATDTPLDYKIKSQLIKDTLILMNINAKSKNQMLQKTQNIKQQKSVANSNKRQLYENQQMRQKVRIAQLKRDQYQKNNMGRYRKAYPVQSQQKTQQYEAMIQYSEKTFFSENNVLRAQIQIQKNQDKQSKRNGSQSPVKLPNPNRLTKKTQSLSERISDQKQKRSSGQSVFNKSQSGKKSALQSFGSCKIQNIKKEAERQLRIQNSLEQIPDSPLRNNLIRRLPRLQSSSNTINSGVLQMKRRQLMTFKRKKLLEYQQIDLKKLLVNKQESNPEKGNFLTPKTVQLKIDLNKKKDKNKDDKQTNLS